jgi:HAMP domain-containing protein
MVRVPLYLKLMVSYVVVVLLVVLPTFVYVQTFQGREVRRLLHENLRAEVTTWADGLARVPPQDLQNAVRLVLGLSTERLTVIDATGAVLGDSAVPERPLDNHLDRPEVRQAFESPEGFGASERFSTTLDADEIYAAARFPRFGPVRGVVRIATSPTAIYRVAEGGLVMLRRAGVVAASAAMLLSLLAALVVSRPLKQIAAGARALANGDFGHRIDIRSRDELGEVATALEDLASRLRDRLLSVGADRASLKALVDDLPVGVVIYRPDGAPDVVNGRARVLCGMTPDLESERAHALFEAPSQAEVVERVLRDGFSLEAPCVLPWAKDVAVRARWIALPATDGTRRAALVLLDEAGPEAARKQVALLSGVSRELRGAARSCADTRLATSLQATAARCDALTPLEPPSMQDVSVCTLTALCEAVLADVTSPAAHRGVAVQLDLADAVVTVVETAGRVERALRELLLACVQRAAKGESLVLRSEPGDAGVRLLVGGRAAPADLEAIGRLVQPIGGEVGTREAEGVVESWILVPRG